MKTAEWEDKNFYRKSANDHKCNNCRYGEKHLTTKGVNWRWHCQMKYRDYTGWCVKATYVCDLWEGLL